LKFLDTKEQVLDIQLTQYGKHILAHGKFMPVYYAFYDDDIIYDIDYVGTSEEQNVSEGRIQEETPRMGTQYVFRGIETGINNIDNNIMFSARSNKERVRYLLNFHKELEKNFRYQTGDDRHNVLPYPLGTSSPKSDNIPAWSISFLEGSLTGSAAFLTGTNCLDTDPCQPLYIPQLKTKATFNIDIIKKSEEEFSPEESHEDSELYFSIPRLEFDDGSAINVRQEAIVLEVIEENAIFDIENFDIEVYEMTPGKKKGDAPIPIHLPFYDPPQDLVFLENDAMELDSSYADYYFDIQVDDEIEPEIFGGNIDNRVKNFFTDKEFIRAKKAHENFKANKERKDIYRVDLGPEDFEEPCED
tara:strand:+ start:1330 stop:2406 length:1077 start_codon:yes stop_codon:yes gene_type:complete